MEIENIFTGRKSFYGYVCGMVRKEEKVKTKGKCNRLFVELDGICSEIDKSEYSESLNLINQQMNVQKKVLNPILFFFFFFFFICAFKMFELHFLFFILKIMWKNTIHIWIVYVDTSVVIYPMIPQCGPLQMFVWCR